MSTLYLAPLGVNDLVHCSLNMSIYKGLDFGWSCNDEVPGNSVIMRSPIILALRSANSGWPGKVRDLVLMHLVKHDLISDPRSDDFLALIELLQPRFSSQPPVKKLMKCMIKKLKNNFGKQGLYDHVMLTLGSFFNHSCAPNTIVKWDTILMEAWFYTLTSVKTHAELCISYTAFPIDDPQKRASLFKFECSCFTCFSKQPPSVVLAINEFCPEFETCWWCGTPTDQVCPDCQRARFCSKECRIADQPIHRAICAVFKEKPRLPSQPILGSYRSIQIKDYRELL